MQFVFFSKNAAQDFCEGNGFDFYLQWNPSIEVPESKTTARRWEGFDFLWADWDFDFDFAWASTEEFMVIGPDN